MGREPGGLPSMGPQSVGQDWLTRPLSLHILELYTTKNQRKTWLGRAKWLPSLGAQTPAQNGPTSKRICTGADNRAALSPAVGPEAGTRPGPELGSLSSQAPVLLCPAAPPALCQTRRRWMDHGRWELAIFTPGPSAGRAGSCWLSEGWHHSTFPHWPCVCTWTNPEGTGLVWGLQWNAESFWNSFLQKTGHRVCLMISSFKEFLSKWL